MNNDYIIKHIINNLDSYKYNNSQLLSITKLYEEINNKIKKGIRDRIKKPIWFIFLPVTILSIILIIQSKSLLTLPIFSITIILTYYYSKHCYFKIISMQLSEFMKLSSIKEVIDNPDTTNIFLIIEKCTSFNQKYEHIVDLDSVATGLNVIIKNNQFKNKFAEYQNINFEQGTKR